MARRLRITVGSVRATATLTESPTARAVWDALPLEVPGQTIRPASPVNVFGRIDGDATLFRGVRAGMPVRLEPVGDAERAP
jgi:hypothetical protein